MITGNARKAKFTIAAWYPTSGMKDVKRKSLPASEKLINFLKILSTLENWLFTKGILRIITANNNCSPIPQKTVLGLIALRLFDKAYAIPKRDKTPMSPVKFIFNNL